MDLLAIGVGEIDLRDEGKGKVRVGERNKRRLNPRQDEVWASKNEGEEGGKRRSKAQGRDLPKGEVERVFK